MWFWWFFGAVVLWASITQPKMTEAEFQKAKAKMFYAEGCIIRQYPEELAEEEQAETSLETSK